MDKIFYVYVFFRPWDGSPCYVGKGKGNRWKELNQHDRTNRHLLRIIAKAKHLGLELPVIKVRENLTESDAFATERAFVAAIGRGKYGPLVNLTDGGEGSTGIRHSKKSKAMISAKALQMWSNAEIRQRIIDARTKAMATPEYRTKRSAISKEFASDPVRRKKQSNVMTERFSDPENRQIASVTTRLAMERPEVKANTIAAQRDRWADPAERKKQSERLTGRTLSLEHCAAIGAGHLGKKRSLEACANMSIAQAMRAPPSAVTRARMSASAKARWSQPPKGT